MGRNRRPSWFKDARPWWRPYGSQYEQMMSMDLGAWGIKFIPQKGFELAPGRRCYVDFYLPEHGIVVEIDGRFHGKKKRREADEDRDRTLLETGKCRRVMRFSLRECADRTAIRQIRECVKSDTPYIRDVS